MNRMELIGKKPREEKESPKSLDSKLSQEGRLLTDKARIIRDSFDPVKVMAACIEYQRLLKKMYVKNMRVK